MLQAWRHFWCQKSLLPARFLLIDSLPPHPPRALVTFLIVWNLLCLCRVTCSPSTFPPSRLLPLPLSPPAQPSPSINQHLLEVLPKASPSLLGHKGLVRGVGRKCLKHSILSRGHHRRTVS